MATELEGNLPLQRFIQLLAELNNQSAAVIKSGDVSVLPAMNSTIEEMRAIQSKGTDDAFTAIDEDMQIICMNFNATVAMINSNENGQTDAATATAVKKFVHNIFDATVRIVYAYGLAECSNNFISKRKKTAEQSAVF